MLAPEVVCENISNMKGNERLENLLDNIDLKKINETSHDLKIKQGTYEGSTLLLCALAKKKFPLVKKLLNAANAESIDAYESLAGSDLTVIRFVPDHLMCELIQKAKFIDINVCWLSVSLLIEVVTRGHRDILLALMQRGYVDLNSLNNCLTDTKICENLNHSIKITITDYLKAIELIGKLPSQPSFNALLNLLSKDDSWLLNACLPNSKVTFKEQIVNRLNHPNSIFQKQLREFYKRFSNLKPADFQLEDPEIVPPSLPPILPTVATSPVVSLQSHQNGVEHTKELALEDLLYQGKHEILIKRLQKGEIAFESLNPFIENPPANVTIHPNCKNVIEACLQWRTEIFQFPNNNAFQKLLELFDKNAWLFVVSDQFNKKSILESTRNKLRIRPQQLKQFNEKFPDCDALLNQSNSFEQQKSDEDSHTLNSAGQFSNSIAEKDNKLKKDDKNSLELKQPSGAISGDALTALQPGLNHFSAVERDVTLAASHIDSEPSARVATPIDGDLSVSNVQLADSRGSSQEANVAISSDHNAAPNSTLTQNVTEEAKENDLPLAQRMRAALKMYSEINADNIGSSALAALAQKHRDDERKKAREESLRKQKEEEAERLGTNIQGNAEPPENYVDLSSPQNPSESAKATATSEPIISDQPKKNLQQFFNEQKDALVKEIYNRENITHDDKQSIINRVKEMFSFLIEGFKDAKIINQNNHHDLLDALCDFYKDVSEEEHKRKINIHSHPTYDRFFRKPNTKSWQNMVKEIRDKSLECLLSVAAEQSNTDPLKVVTFLNNYINEPLFCEHRSNVAICRVGDTNAVKQIKQRIAEYSGAIRKAKPLPNHRVN